MTPSNSPTPLACTLGTAKLVYQKILDGVTARQSQQTNDPLPDGVSPVALVDAINSPVVADQEYRQLYGAYFPPPVNQPPSDQYPSIFEAKGNFMIGSVRFFLNQTLGDFGLRDAQPDVPSGDKNYIESGHGGTEVNIPVLGCPVGIELLPDTNTAQPFYTAPTGQ